VDMRAARDKSGKVKARMPPENRLVAQTIPCAMGTVMTHKAFGLYAVKTVFKRFAEKLRGSKDSSAVFYPIVKSVESINPRG
jgi:hypothetical protein